MNAAAGTRTGRWWPAALFVVAAVLATWLWQGVRSPATPGGTAPVRLPASAGAEAVSPPTAQRAAVPGAPDPPVAVVVVSDATAPDLRRVYDDESGSADPRRRRMAARAFAACIPLFVPSAGETPSPEPMIRGLPRAARAEREAAYRTLFARCGRFLDERAGEIAAMRDHLQRDGQSQEPALRAQEALLAGRRDEVGPLVAEALNGGDPAALAALSGLTERLARNRESGAADPGSLVRARAVDAALAAVACDLGLDCGSQSLRALQLCAVEGLCEGDVMARMQARYGQGVSNPAAVEEERTRLHALIRSGRPLTVADLLP